jgi:dynactin 1
MLNPVFMGYFIVTGCDRIQAQFNHLAETYFKAFDFDLGEREFGLVLSLDHDLDVYASSMGLTKTAVEAILNDEGEFSQIYSCLVDYIAMLDVTHDLDGMEPETSFLVPIQKSLDQCKTAKIVARWVHFCTIYGKLLNHTCRKLIKRLEELAHESSALKAYLVPQLDALCNIVSEMVNFGIQVSIVAICPFLFTPEIIFSSLNKRCLMSMKYALPNPLSN